MTDRELAQSAINNACRALEADQTDTAAVWAQIAQAHATLALEATFGVDLSGEDAA